MSKRAGNLPELQETAVAMRADGASWAAIGKAVGRHASTVKCWINPHFRGLVRGAIKRHSRTPGGIVGRSLSASRTDARKGGYAACTADAETLLSALCYVCPICEKDMPRPVLDHCHRTGKFRGWICSDCNAALGYARENAKALRRMADYVEEHSQ